jgi:hypothetical protein
MRDKALINRLMDWGDWIAKPVKGLNYPSVTVEHRLMKLGMGASITFQRAWIPAYKASPRNNETHRAVCALNLQRRSLVYCKFVHKLREAEAMEACGLSKTKYHETLKVSLSFLAGRLGHQDQ